MPDDQRRVPHVVVDHDRLGQREPQLREIDLVGVVVGNALDEAHPVVAHRPDRAAHEARKLEPLGNRGLQARQLLAQDLQRDPRRPECAPSHPLRLHSTSRPARAEDGARAGADEAVAGPLLPALDGFEQEGGPSVVEPPEQGERRVEIGEDLPHDRNQVPARRESFERFLGGAVQHGLGRGPEESCPAWKKRCNSVLLSNASEASSKPRSASPTLSGPV